MLASPALAEEEPKEQPKAPETSLKRDDAKRHVTCQVECEKDGEDPYSCEEFCIQMANLNCAPTATVAKK